MLIDESWQGNRWVVETDIANCFEAIPHDGLIRAVQERVSDRSVLKLLRAMLRAGVMSDGQVRRSVTTRHMSSAELCPALVCSSW